MGKKIVYSLEVKDPELAKTILKYQNNPELILLAPKDNQKWYVRGFFDSQGSVFIDEDGFVILSILSENPKKIDVTQKILQDNYNIHSIVFHGQHTDIVHEPSRLLILGLWDMAVFNVQIGMENGQLRERFLVAINKLMDEECSFIENEDEK